MVHSLSLCVYFVVHQLLLIRFGALMNDDDEEGGGVVVIIISFCNYDECGYFKHHHQRLEDLAILLLERVSISVSPRATCRK